VPGAQVDISGKGPLPNLKILYNLQTIIKPKLAPVLIIVPNLKYIARKL